jgi:transposase
MTSLSRRQRDALQKIIHHSGPPRALTRAQALLWLAEGKSPTEVADVLKISRQSLYNWRSRIESGRPSELQSLLADAPRSGRPASASDPITPLIEEVIDANPREFGYHRVTWTAPLLQHYLGTQHGIEVSADSVHRVITRLRIRWKRPRHVLALRDPHWRQSKGGSKEA